MSKFRPFDKQKSITEIVSPRIIKEPKSTDVLCGRGKICFDHDGNDSFRVLIAQHADSYQTSPSKKAKMEVIMEVVDTVTSRGGRFLVRRDKDKVGEGWVDGGVKQGKKKTGHALRDALRGRVKCISEMRAKNKEHDNLSTQFDLSTQFSVPSPYPPYPQYPSYLPHPYTTPMPMPPPASLPSLEENHSFLSDDEMMPECQDEMNHAKAMMKLEPEREWRRNSEVDNALKTDLLDFFGETKERIDDKFYPQGWLGDV